MEILFTAEGLISLLTLSLLEIVLGIDNIIFISLLTNKLPEKSRPKARFLGISLALVFRIIMLLGITWIIEFTEPLFTLFNQKVTGRDLILMAGGLFLLAKSTSEIHEKMDPKKEEAQASKKTINKGLMSIIIQIGLLDIVFSFDSILTAIGMTDELVIMISAVIISLIVMLIFSKRISNFIEKYPTLQVLALSFLILIGFVLIADGLHFHIPKGYIYVAVAFSLIVEVINIKSRSSKSSG